MSLSFPHEQTFKSTLIKFDPEEIQSESEDDTQSQNKLNTYRTIMTKGKNIFFKFNNSHLLFIKSSSFFRICDLARLRPEENILFSLYLTEKSLEQYKQTFNQTSPKSSSNYNMKYHFKQAVLNSINKHTSIANKPLFYQQIWHCLYYLLAVISLLYLIGIISYFIKETKVLFNIIEIETFMISILGFIVSGIGFKKFYRHKVYHTIYENILLSLMMLFSITMVIICEVGKENIIGKEMKIFYVNYFFCFYLCCFLCVGCGICLLWFNVKMFDFYKKYYDELTENGIMLEDINDDEKKEIS
jgi:hypothetical protein